MREKTCSDLALLRGEAPFRSGALRSGAHAHGGRARRLAALLYFQLSYGICRNLFPLWVLRFLRVCGLR